MNVYRLLLVVLVSGVSCTRYEDRRLKNLKTMTPEINWKIVTSLINDPMQLVKISRQDWQPRSLSQQEIIYSLYHQNCSTKGTRIFPDDINSLVAAGFNSSKQVIFVTHGFLSSANEIWVLQLINALFSTNDSNIITMDWSECAGTWWYPTAKKCVATLGRNFAEMASFLAEQGVDVSQMHLIGHSLGAHLMAQVSRYGHKVGRITGLDPAGPLFGTDTLEERLDPSDAQVVDVIHTNAGWFGYDGVLGDFDFFPNGGDDQPGCFINMACDHSSAIYYFIQSLYYYDKYPSYKCYTVREAEKGKCTGPVAYMGENSILSEPGIYYTRPTRKPLGLP